jgi:hypothetical protein
MRCTLSRHERRAVEKEMLAKANNTSGFIGCLCGYFHFRLGGTAAGRECVRCGVRQLLLVGGVLAVTSCVPVVS